MRKSRNATDYGDYIQADFTCSAHGDARLNRRSLKKLEVRYIYQYGRLVKRTGIEFYFLGRRDVPKEDRKLAWIQRLIGTVILISADGQVLITGYKNQQALRTIRKKSKYRMFAPVAGPPPGTTLQ